MPILTDKGFCIPFNMQHPLDVECRIILTDGVQGVATCRYQVGDGRVASLILTHCLQSHHPAKVINLD